MAVDVPDTVWRKTNGLNDSESTGETFIVDTTGDYLVDPDGDYVVDTGIEMAQIPATEWEEDDSI